jgi:NAD(P)-dependent dehydrogenase (short-subunit alcohol dehydrogenase family)
MAGSCSALRSSAWCRCAWRGAYNASKHALEALTLTMRMELENSGIHVSLIEPGPITSRIALNAVPYVEKYIDLEGSVHRGGLCGGRWRD